MMVAKINDFGKQAGKVTASLVNGTKKTAKKMNSNLSQVGNKAFDGTGKKVKASGGSVSLFNSKLRKKSVDDYNGAVERYESIAKKVEIDAQSLYELRKLAIVHIRYVEKHINQLANTPKEFKLNLQKITTEIAIFENKESEIKEAERQAKAAAGGTGAGATLGALGIAVATMGPTAAMGVATTFGVASTGTAISTLSGAAASNAALAWIGGGALTAGGGGISAGTALLALAGPVGWTIAGIAGATAIGSGIFASHKNKKIAEQLLTERQNVEEIIRKFNSMHAEIKAITNMTRTQIEGVEKANSKVRGADYSLFSLDEKIQAGMLVNSTLTLAQLINKEVKLND